MVGNEGAETMNAIEIEQKARDVVVAAERNVGAARGKYVAGELPYEAIGEAEADLEKARQGLAATNPAADAIRTQRAAVQAAQAAEVEKRRRKELCAVERRRRDELREKEGALLPLLSEEDRNDLLEIAKLEARVKLRISER